MLPTMYDHYRDLVREIAIRQALADAQVRRRPSARTTSWTTPPCPRSSPAHRPPGLRIV